MVELQLPKLVVRVRFPSLAPGAIYLRMGPGFLEGAEDLQAQRQSASGGFKLSSNDLDSART